MHFNYLFSGLLILSAIFLPLHGGMIYRDQGRFYISDDQKSLSVIRGIPSLDFSKEYPALTDLEIQVSLETPYYYWHAKDDHGLTHNVNVKTLMVGGVSREDVAPSQKLLKWAHMPNVQILKLTGIYEDLNYLTTGFLFVDTLEIKLYSEQFYPKRNEFFKTLENISKLPHLEHLTFELRRGWNNSELTQQELSIIGKMQELKTLKFIFSDLPHGQRGFTNQNFNLLKTTLPNTEIKMEVHYSQPPKLNYDGG